MDYTEVIYNLCDVFFIIYNKLADKGCYQQNLMEYLLKLDDYINVCILLILIKKYFINAITEELLKVAEFYVNKQVDQMTKQLDKIYN
jgi:hypothetical protein